ncbi:Imm26 family immunity protein [Curtobacterium sp. 18060]|uniref:Imm26 family immunity protein n=1 Tax=Curtobacterium sp. 18060 TaxID=2681408 RepID=UPI001357F25A|nr:Imm26 family immunity protein [Curtobacterium sp. 18060]
MSSQQQIYPVAVGDVFTVPLDDSKVVLGQVIGKYTKALYVIIFDLVAPVRSVQTLHFSDVTAATPLLARMTLDARFRPGMWQIVGNSIPDHRRFLPAFSHGSEDYDGVHVTNFDGSRMRRATADDARRVPHLTVDSPMDVGKAVRAHHGLEPRRPVYDDLRYRPTPTSWELFGESRSARADSARAAPEQQSVQGNDHGR